MKFLAIIILAMQIAVSATTSQEEYEYIGQLPKIVIEAPRYELEDDAWSGLLPEVTVYAEKDAKIDGVLIGANQKVQHFSQLLLEFFNPIVSLALVGTITLASSILALLMIKNKHVLHKVRAPKKVYICRKGDQCCK